MTKMKTTVIDVTNEAKVVRESNDICWDSVMEKQMIHELVLDGYEVDEILTSDELVFGRWPKEVKIFVTKKI